MDAGLDHVLLGGQRRDDVEDVRLARGLWCPTHDLYTVEIADQEPLRGLGSRVPVSGLCARDVGEEHGGVADLTDGALVGQPASDSLARDHNGVVSPSGQPEPNPVTLAHGFERPLVHLRLVGIFAARCDGLVDLAGLGPSEVVSLEDVTPAHSSSSSRISVQAFGSCTLSSAWAWA